MNDRVAKVAPNRVDGALEDGRLTVSLRDPTATVAVDVPEHQPLSRHERVATLSIAGDDLSLEIDLSADDLKPLADALAEVRDS